MSILDKIWRLGAPSSTDPADDGDAITGSAQAISPPSRGIHCNTDGTIVVTMSGPLAKTMTYYMTKGGVYPYSISAVVSVSGGFTGNVVR